MDTVIVLSGTRFQIPLIKRLKDRGLKVVCFNLFPNSPAFEYADDYRVVDILNFEKCLALAKEIKPSAIMSDESDIAVPNIAKLSETLGLKSIGSKRLYSQRKKVKLWL